MYTDYQSLTNSLNNLDNVSEQQQQTSRSSYQLYRYTHEPVSSNLVRRDIPPILILIFFLFLIVIIISQILVVHTSRYGNNFSTMQKIQEELKKMDESMETILHDNVLPINKWRLLFHIQTHLYRFEYLFALFNNQSHSTIEHLHQTKIHFYLINNINESNEILKQENYTSHSIKNIKHVQNGYEQLTDDNNNYSSRWKRKKQNYDDNNNHKSRNHCNEQPSLLKGRILDENSTFPNISLYEMEMNYSNIRFGGEWSPSNCLARHKVAIIIPYRDRLEHLITLLYYLHPILQRQELDYKIYVSEQIGNGTYNKGILMNAAFIYASNEYDFQCFVFHDVDLIPENDRNMYSCPVFPRHMSAAVNEMNYKLSYEELIGGVLNIRTEHFLTVNGYSNLYWGWGAEDDDLYYRLKEVSLKVLRPPSSIARYKMLQHKKRTPSIWNKRAKLLYSAAKRYTWDGVSSARYNLTSVTAYPLFTHIYVDVGSPPPGFS
ncbi:unnamed protein product [Rotaria magnacalcarata]|uniref:Beta-1,4-galactosyltransferase n=2 Tax=Rotaria magnacalcarata TaxID=392030 RepID=A0A815Y0V0_9BILA|nr:unnamed protein product [Rotaria magnacalcarata]